MSISSVKINIDGTDHYLSYNTTSGKWEKTINAPGSTSWHQSNHEYNCIITAVNTAGTSVTSNAKLRVKETIKPTINITSPSSGAYISNNKQPIVFTVIDENGGSGINIDTLSVKLDDKTITGVFATGITNGFSCKYTPSLAMVDGSHSVFIDVSDNDGNTATQKSVTFVVDTVPPTLNIMSPIENLVTAKTSIVVSGNTNDNTSSPVSVVVKVNGGTSQTVTVGGDGTFTKTVTCVVGANTITITATDGAGKTSTVTRHLTIDLSVPKITETSISPNPVDAGETMIVKVKVV